VKFEWKKSEKTLYLPGVKPELVTVPAMNFFIISGNGNPNDEFFADYIRVLYSLSYGVKMGLKQEAAQGSQPEGYCDYTVYPLEGVWDLSEAAKAAHSGTLDKDTLVFKLMMRQPDFVSADCARQTIERIGKKKPQALLDQVRFERLAEGQCVQMLHVGSYDDEPATVAEMERFIAEQELHRTTLKHREIYISNPNSVEPGKMKTVLRFQVEQQQAGQNVVRRAP
jgi:hypothetical protein